MVATVELLDALRQFRLLEPAQLEEAGRLSDSAGGSASALLDALVKRGLLSSYQADMLTGGRGHELLLGSYVLLDRLGVGGMGAVYKARQWKFGRIVALKQIRAERLSDETNIQRFRREIRACATLDHPNIIRAYDADEVRGVHFYTMEYVEGLDLATEVKERGPLPVRTACDYIRQVALGLSHAHDCGMIHRDIKPSNLLVEVPKPQRPSGSMNQQTPLSSTSRRLVKILDMGLARFEASDEASSLLTATGMVMGTPDFLAPEQTRDARSVDIRADLYSLGCTFYFLLAGRVPFPGTSVGAKLVKHQLEEPKPLEQLRPDVPPGVAAIIRKLMAKKPADRYQTPAELAGVLADPELMNAAARAAAAPPPVIQPIGGVADAADSSGTAAGNLSLSTPPMSLPEAITATESLVDKFRHRRAAREAAQRRLLLIVAFASPLVIGAAVISWLVYTGSTEHAPRPAPANPPPVKAPSRKTATTRPTTPAQESQDDRARKQREVDADAALAHVTAILNQRGITFEAFAKEVAGFKTKHGGTRAAVQAADMLMKLPSPLDRLDAKNLPEDCFAQWKAAGQQPPGELVAVAGEHHRRHWGPIIHTAFAADGKTVVSFGVDQVCQLWNTVSGAGRVCGPSARANVACLALSPDGKFLAVAAAGGPSPIKLFDVVTGDDIRELEGSQTSSTRWTANAAFSPDGKLFAALNYGDAGQPENDVYEKGAAQLGIWDVASGKRKQWLNIRIGWQVALPMAFSPNGKALALRVFSYYDQKKGENRYKVLYIDVASGEQTAVHESTGGAWGIQFTSRSDQLLYHKVGNTVAVWDVKTRADVRSFEVSPGDRFALSPDGKFLAISGGGLYDFSAGKSRHDLNVQGLPAFSPNSKEVAYGDATNGAVRLWDVETGKELQPLTGHLGPVTAVAFSADCATLISGGTDSSLRLWGLPGEKGPRVLQAATPVRSIDFLPDGRSFVAGGDVCVRNWSMESASWVANIGGTSSNVALTPDGSLLFASEGQGVVFSREAASGKFLGNFTGHLPLVRALAVSPDGKTLAVGSGNHEKATGEVRLWDIASGHERGPWAIASPVLSLAFSPDGGTLAVGSQSGVSVQLYDFRTGIEQARLTSNSQVHGVYAMRYSPDGRTLACIGNRGEKYSLMLWDPINGKVVKEIAFPGRIRDVAFASDGRHLTTANSNGTVYILRVAEGPPRALSAEEAKQQQQDEAKRLATPTQISNSIGMSLSLIPAGRFLMGSPENDRQSTEELQHEVSITKPFFLGTYEVTQSEYEKVIGANPSKFNKQNGGGPNHPVEMVSWDEAIAFCTKLSELPDEKNAGRVYRLPASAEWEYACRAGSQSAYSFGDDPNELGRFAWTPTNSEYKTHAVGQLLPNPWGLFDIHGNVFEICAEQDAPGTRLRGGGSGRAASCCRSAHRSGGQPTERWDIVGFRVVCDYRPPQITNSIGMKLARIPAGRFLMGSPETESGRQPNEGPQHEVTITRPFHIGVYEVTQAEYEKIVGTNPSQFSKANGGGPENPVEMVSWDDAIAFCKKLSELPAEKKAGRVYRLPTEAEWEYACRAGAQTAYSFGDNVSQVPEYAWFRDNTPDRTRAVGTRRPNPWGLFDMHGNVWEWTLDPLYNYTNSSAIDPRCLVQADQRALRGGGVSTAGVQWDAIHQRSAIRYLQGNIKSRFSNIGFRVVCELPPADKSGK